MAAAAVAAASEGSGAYRFVTYGAATLRQRVEAAYHVFYEWRGDHEAVNQVRNVTQMMAFLDHETAYTVLLTDPARPAEGAPRFVGVASVMVEEPEGFLRNRAAPKYWVCNVLVHPAYRRQGCAGRLLARTEDWAREGGATEAHLWCLPGLAAFYQARGWEPRGDFEAKPGTLHLAKALEKPKG